MNRILLKEILQKSFKEDIGMGDLTTESIFHSNERAKGTFMAKADGVLAGAECIQIGYELLGGQLDVVHYKWDGQAVSKGDVIVEVEGPIRTLLTGERVILNLVQHLSGIASATRKAITELGDSSITVTDTRKTLPGLRALQKYAVRCGGGKNHRYRLDDGIMIKDNHIKAAGSINKAVEMVKTKSGHMVKIEVETENKEQVLKAVAAKVDVIMLDNRSPEQVKELVKFIPDTITVEVSGGITLETIGTYKNCGADVISLGGLTHSVKALDISFNLNND
ncbi:MAG: carboxylating nicotinate-nucleotide diphosphorylase [Balneolaceae bacterium]|nr:carboxylating nicotinate-nucleotide diphosphorylase [Balneolaceae bacterium]